MLWSAWAYGRLNVAGPDRRSNSNSSVALGRGHLRTGTGEKKCRLAPRMALQKNRDQSRSPARTGLARMVRGRPGTRPVARRETRMAFRRPPKSRISANHRTDRPHRPAARSILPGRCRLRNDRREKSSQCSLSGFPSCSSPIRPAPSAGVRCPSSSHRRARSRGSDQFEILSATRPEKLKAEIGKPPNRRTPVRDIRVIRGERIPSETANIE